jgi:hypothetical protein
MYGELESFGYYPGIFLVQMVKPQLLNLAIQQKQITDFHPNPSMYFA